MDTRMRGFLALLLALAWLGAAASMGLAAGEIVEVEGRTWEIAEPDALTEIEERAARLDLSGLPRAAQAAVGRPGHPLPPALERRVRHQVPWAAAPFDVPDGRGGVLYPKGFRFNPLEYVTLPGAIAVAGDGEADAAWLASAGARWVLTTGDAKALGERLGRPVYALDARAVERLGLAAAPSLVTQEGARLRIEEIPLPPSPAPPAPSDTANPGESLP